MTAHSAHSPLLGLVVASREEAGNEMMNTPTMEKCSGPPGPPSSAETESSSSCSGGASTSEACQAGAAAAAPSAASDTRCTMKVAVTVLSLHGVTSKKKKKKKKVTASKDSSAAIVASFSQNLTNETSRVFLTHVPSLQTQLDLSTDNSQPVFHWPADESLDDAGSRKLSTLEFTRTFVRESGTTDRYVPQTCPVNLSIQRGSKLALLGKADLIINGEENGASSITVPISPAGAREKSTVKKLKNKATKSQSNMSVKVKDDIFRFQLDGTAMLRVSVHVSDPSQQGEGQSATTPSTVKCHGDVYDDDDDDDSSLEQDDYAGCILENNELRTLRQELARSEQTNNVLQIELATAQQYRAETEKLRLQLDKATKNAESLLSELNKAKSESDLLPFYETRVNELLVELRNRDLEVHFLKDEVEELKGQWKKEQVSSLLWENEFEETSSSVKDGNFEEGSEGKSCTEGGSWGVRRLGASLLSIEERLRAQQRKVREEQQRLQQEGLSTSRHGKTAPPLERVDEEADEQKDANEDCCDDVSEQSDGPETRIDPFFSRDTKDEGASEKDSHNIQKNHFNPIDTAADSGPEIDSAEVSNSMSNVDSSIWKIVDELEKKSSIDDDGSLVSSQAPVCALDESSNATETVSIPGEQEKCAEVESGQSKLEEITENAKENAPVRGWGVRRIGAGLRGLEKSMRDQQRRHQEQQRLAAAAMSEGSDKVLKRHTFHGSGEEPTKEAIVEKTSSVVSSAPESDDIGFSDQSGVGSVAVAEVEEESSVGDGKLESEYLHAHTEETADFKPREDEVLVAKIGRDGNVAAEIIETPDPVQKTLAEQEEIGPTKPDLEHEISCTVPPPSPSNSSSASSAARETFDLENISPGFIGTIDIPEIESKSGAEIGITEL